MPKAKKLPSGSWRVQASKTVNGNLIRKSFTDIDKRKAEALAAQWQTDTAQMCDIENITLRQAYDRYIASKEIFMNSFVFTTTDENKVDLWYNLSAA